MNNNNTFIYCLIDPITNLVRYIGKTINPNCRKEVHRKKDWNPIFEILDEVPTAEWKFWERHYISLYSSWGFVLENKNPGGGGPTIHTIETKRKISLSLSGNKNPNYGKTTYIKGKKLSEITKKKISLAGMGNKRALGTKRTDETKLKLSMAKLGTKNPMHGIPSPLTGKTFSEEHRRKLSESKKGKKLSKEHIEAKKGHIPWNKGLKGIKYKISN